MSVGITHLVRTSLKRCLDISLSNFQILFHMETNTIYADIVSCIMETLMQRKDTRARTVAMKY